MAYRSTLVALAFSLLLASIPASAAGAPGLMPATGGDAPPWLVDGSLLSCTVEVGGVPVPEGVLALQPPTPLPMANLCDSGWEYLGCCDNFSGTLLRCREHYCCITRPDGVQECGILCDVTRCNRFCAL